MRQRGLILVLLCGLLAGCERDAAVPAQQQYEISGTLTYRERVMLPTEARVELALLNGDGQPVADTTFLVDQQPPIPFTLHVPRAGVDTTRVYTLAARLSAEDGNLVWSTPEPVAVLTRGAPRQLELVLATERRPEAPLGEPWREARERGVTFRAIGQEPPWMLDMYGPPRAPRRLVLTLDYGDTTLDFAQVLRDEDGDGHPRYRASAEEARLEVVVEDRLCRDVMSGEEFEAVVSLRVDGQLLFGCGRELS